MLKVNYYCRWVKIYQEEPLLYFIVYILDPVHSQIIFRCIICNACNVIDHSVIVCRFLQLQPKQLEEWLGCGEVSPASSPAQSPLPLPQLTSTVLHLTMKKIATTDNATRAWKVAYRPKQLRHLCLVPSAITGTEEEKSARQGLVNIIPYPFSAYIVTIFPVIKRSSLSVVSKESEGKEQFSCGGGARPDRAWWAGLLELHSDLAQVDPGCCPLPSCWSSSI